MSDHLTLWNQVCKTDPKYTKKITHGARLTSIGAQWQKRQATGIWGAYGATWGLKDLKWGAVKDKNGDTIEVTLEAMFWCPVGEFPICTDIAYRPGNDTRKKVQTDALTKALSYLGFSADVFMDEMSSKYDPPKPVPLPPAPKLGFEGMMNRITTADWKGHGSPEKWEERGKLKIIAMCTEGEITEDQGKALKARLKEVMDGLTTNTTG